ncbi:MAG: helix-turn-helix domain-containing protein [Clostridium sp.]|uniref:helix-turn-helix domain-containing protein n=1 Tax=Clostridium sp. TaxID=1506 RepID=UPI003D6D1704
MEILSTGEKIKRTRIYKGYTLREMCDDKISVSKMSCIENNKVMAEPWVIELISKKLDIDIAYLNEDVRQQVEVNIKALREQVKNGLDSKDDDFESKASYNLEFAQKYNYYELAIELMHMLFNFYLDKRDFEKTQSITAEYYDLYLKTSVDDSQLTYYMDMARHLYIKEEYLQASSYYCNVRRRLSECEVPNNKKLIVVTYNEAACDIMLKNYVMAYEVGITLLDLLEYVDTDFKAAEIYHMLAMLSIRMKNGKFEEYEKKSYELYKDRDSSKAGAIYNYGSTMLDCNMKDRGVEYIKKGLACYPRDNMIGLVSFMLDCVNELIENDVLELAKTISDEVLNYAINLDDIKFIEKGYYYKAVILNRQEQSSSAEMYMNLSLDSLLKFGGKQEIYGRYLEMGSMYHKLGSVAESIKYFSLALQLEKKM